MPEHSPDGLGRVPGGDVYPGELSRDLAGEHGEAGERWMRGRICWRESVPMICSELANKCYRRAKVREIPLVIWQDKQLNPDS